MKGSDFAVALVVWVLFQAMGFAFMYGALVLGPTWIAAVLFGLLWVPLTAIWTYKMATSEPGRR